MGKLIYLISLLEGIDLLSLLLSLITIPVTVLVIYGYVDIHYMRDEVKMKKDIANIMTKGIFVLVISLLTMVLIPDKEEMYLIALTKDYDKEELYQMSKDEIKNSIDYVFYRVKELKDE